MKIVVRVFLYLMAAALLLALLAAAGGWAATSMLMDDQPELSAYEKTSLEDLKRIKQLAIEFSRQTSPGAPKRISLSERDINLAIGHFVPRQARLPKQTFFAVSVGDDNQATVIATAPARPLLDLMLQEYNSRLLPWARTAADRFKGMADDRWLNLQLHFRVDQGAEHGQWLTVERLRVGRIPLSGDLSRDIAARVIAQLQQRPDLRLARESWTNIRKLAVENRQLLVEFVIPTRGMGGIGGIEALVLQPGEQELIDIYSAKLAALPRSGALVKVIAPLFEFASQRSLQSGDPIAENRALLLTLAKRYGGEQLLQMLESGQRRFQNQVPKPYTIYGRHDLAQHYVLSAGLSLIASQDLAELFGIDKELNDLLGGRSISAWDLMADKAGLRLAENATLSASSALETQKWFSRARRDSHLIPDLGAEFAYSEDRFGPEELEQLELMIELYLEQHPALRKKR